jgi:hypothetical protein
MNNSARMSLALTIAATLCFLGGLYFFGYWRESQTPPTDRLAYSRLYLEAFKVIVVSFFVALLGILIPARIREVRYNFEKLKESRIAYSLAKTGVTYLPLRMCNLTFAEASTLIQEVHFQKHQAELYKELKQHVAHLQVSKRRWSDEMFVRLVDYGEVLEAHSAIWDSSTLSERLTFLQEPRVKNEQRYPNGVFTKPPGPNNKKPKR